MATSTTARSRTSRATANAEQPKRSRREGKGGFSRMLLMLLVILLIVIGSVGGTLFYLWKTGSLNLFGASDAEATEVSEAAPKAVEAPKSAPDVKPIFTALEPFTVTLTDGQRSRILYVVITLHVDDEDSRRIITEFMPIVRDRVLKTLSAQDPFEVQRPQGRDALVKALEITLTTPYSSHPDTRPNISNVLFTAFVVQ